MVDMGQAVWRGIADFGNLFKAQKQAGAGFDELGRKSDQSSQKGESFGSKVTAGLQKVGPKLKTTGRDMTVGLTLPIVALGVKAVQSFSNFESSIVSAGAKTGATASQIEAMKQVALDMGAKTKFSAGEAATAMDNMAAAGFSAEGAMEALPGVMLAAQASGEDLGEVADITAKAINAFSLEAKDATHVADVFATASNTSAIDVHGLGEALAHAGQLGSSANQDLEDVVAVLGRLVDMGVPAASAGAGLRQALQSLKSPTTKARGYIADLGIVTRDLSGQMLPLPDLLDNLDGALSDTNPKFEAAAKAAGMTNNAYRDMAMQALFGVEGQQAMNLAMSDGKPLIIDVAKETEKMAQLQKGLAKTMGEEGARAWIAARTNAGKFSASGAAAVRALGALNRASDGTSKKIGDIMSDTTKARLDQLGGSFETLAITLVGIVAPALTKIIKGVTGAVNAFAGFAKAHPGLAKIAVALLAVLAVVGPLLIGIGMLVTAIGAIAGLGAATLGVIGIVIVAIAALIAIAVLVYKNWGPISGFFVNLWNTVKDAVITAWNAIGSFLSSVWTAISGTASSIWGGIAGFFTGLWNGIKGVFTTVWNAIASFLSTVWGGITAAASAVWNALVAIIMVPVNLIKSIVQTAFNGLMLWWQTFWGVFGGLITAVWDLIVAVITLAMTVINGVMAAGWALIKGAAVGAWNALTSWLTAAWTAISKVASTIWNGMVTVARAVWIAITGAISGSVKALGAALSTIWNGIKSAAAAVWNAIKTAAGATWKTIQQVVLAPIKALWSLLSGPLNVVKTAIAGIWNTIKTGVASAWKSIVDSIVAWVIKIDQKVSQIKDKVVGFFKGAGSWLLNAGKQIIQGLIDGITGMIGKLTGKISEVTEKVAKFLPGSPVKKGALRVLNRGYAGGQIMKMVATGIKTGARKHLEGSMKKAVAVVRPHLGTPKTIPRPVLNGGKGATVPVPPVATSSGDDCNCGGGNTYYITVNNPVGETTAESTSKAVTRLAALGVTG